MKPELLIWRRNRAKVTVEDAAKAAAVTSGDIEAWEAGGTAPSLNQLRCLAAKYHFPPCRLLPAGATGRLRAAAGLPPAAGSWRPSITANLAFHIRTAYERRELALELHDDLREIPRVFPLKAQLGDDPEVSGHACAEARHSGGQRKLCRAARL